MTTNPRATALALCCAALALGSCAAFYSSKSQSQLTVGVAPVSMGQSTQVPKRPLHEELTHVECPAKPWVNKTPPDDGQFRYFVGLSNRYATEREARDDAMRHARTQFVSYVHADVENVFKEWKQSIGKSSATIDPTITTESLTKLASEGAVSRVKDVEWCVDRWRVMRGDQPQGSKIEARVLASVPLDEYDKVLERARERLRREEKRLIAERVRLLDEADRAFKTSQSNEATGRIVTALKSLGTARDRLAKALAVAVPRAPEPPLTEVQIESAERRLVTGVTLSPMPARQTIEPGETPHDLAVKATYAGTDGELPVAGLPVFFFSDDMVFPPTQTNADGVATLQMHTMAKNGQFAFYARIQRAPLEGQISAEALAALAGKRANFLVEVRPATLQQEANDLVRELASKIPNTNLRVIVGNFTYGDKQNTGVAGSFADRFADLVSTKLAGQGRLKKHARGSLRGLTRGLGPGPEPSQIALARESGADAVLYGKYYKEGDFVVVTAQVDDLDARQLAAAQVRINDSVIPKEWALTPPNYVPMVQVVRPLNDHLTSAFRLDLWIDRGNGGIYRAGEKLYVNVRASRDCYLRLVYFDAGGNKILIFPNAFQRDNHIRAGEVVQIPGSQARFDFTVQAPFGSEVLAAFASTAPFPPAKGEEIGNGMVLLDGDPESVIARQRSVAVTTQRAEARVTLTTMAKGE